MKKHVLILGAGFGGLELATRLSETLEDAVRVTLLDRNDSFVFGFSKLDLMLGRQSADDVRLPYSSIEMDGVEFHRDRYPDSSVGSRVVLVPSVVSGPLAGVAGILRCPVCAGPLSAASRTLRCDRGHSFDVARHGYVALMPPRRRPARGDDAAMVAARVAVLDGKHFAPLTTALVRAAVDTTAGDAPVVLDVGAGTGHHLAAVLDVLPGARGVALDASKAALRRAVRAHPRIAGVAGDVWHELPVGDATVDLALNVFAPRNAGELARALRPGGALAVATPAPGHLRELAALHRVGVDPRKRERLLGTLEGSFDLAEVRRVAWELRLTRPEAAALVRMGPAARHLTPAVERRLRALPETLAVTAAVDLHIFRRSQLAHDPARGHVPVARAPAS